jgi:hypothetical protein
VSIRVQVDKTLANAGFLDKVDRPLSAKLPVTERVQELRSTFWQNFTETCLQLFNQSHRSVCMIQTHAHEN